MEVIVNAWSLTVNPTVAASPDTSLACFSQPPGEEVHTEKDSDSLLHLHVIGICRLTFQGLELPCAPSVLRLLAFLALNGQSTRLQVASVLWEAETRRALHNLRMLLHNLRRQLGCHAGVLHCSGNVLSLLSSRISVQPDFTPDTNGRWKGFVTVGNLLASL